MAGRTEHRRVARRLAAERVTPRIVGAAVRLDLDDARREAGPVAGAHEHLVQELGRELERVAVVERRAAACGRARRHGARSPREPLPLLVQALARRVELARDRLGPGAAGRRPPAHRAPRLEQTEAVGSESRVVRHELVERHPALDRLAHESADDRVRLAERRAALDEVLGEIGRRAHRIVGRRDHASVDELRGRDQAR